MALNSILKLGLKSRSIDEKTILLSLGPGMQSVYFAEGDKCVHGYIPGVNLLNVKCF